MSFRHLIPGKSPQRRPSSRWWERQRPARQISYPDPALPVLVPSSAPLLNFTTPERSLATHQLTRSLDSRVSALHRFDRHASFPTDHYCLAQIEASDVPGDFQTIFNVSMLGRAGLASRQRTGDRADSPEGKRLSQSGRCLRREFRSNGTDQ